MVFSKFIIEGSSLIMAKCTYHKQLATNKDDIKGGGWFRFDADKKEFILGGSSHDFGPVDIEDLKKCIETDNVYGNSRQSRKMLGFKFLFDIGSSIIPLN